MQIRGVAYRKSSNSAGSEVAWHSVLLVTSHNLGIVLRNTCLQEFEGAEIDGRVGEHTDETHGQAAIGRLDGALLVHLLRGLNDELVAS